MKRLKYFNPRPRKEGDYAVRAELDIYTRFQSTPSQRGRRLFISFNSVNKLFQSTPSQRGRLMATDVPIIIYAISIHALAKRATPQTRFYTAIDIFQSTPSQRGRHTGISVEIISSVFQSTPSQRGRPMLRF